VADALGGFDAQAIYDEVSKDYEEASRQFWQYLSARTVERLDLRAGEAVLDVPCGTGPSLLPAAERVGPSGSVLGIDVAEQMVTIARQKAEARGIHNVEFRLGDMTALDPALGPFDAVVCCLGLFFVADMPALVRSLYQLVRPGSGRLAVTVFGEHVFDPIREVFVGIVNDVAPELEVIEPWRRTEDASLLRGIFDAAGVDDVAVTTEDERLPLSSPDDWWRIVMGSGFRHTVIALGEERAAVVRARCDAYIRDHGLDEIVIRGHYMLARR
jgi:ubiquinone/menaquinone biosynthesis C-methylase UbiE